MYRDLTEEMIEEKLREIFARPQRRIVLYTGIGGADNFDETIERRVGYTRVYIGKKVPRLLRSLKFTIHRSKRMLYYKLVKNDKTT